MKKDIFYVKIGGVMGKLKVVREKGRLVLEGDFDIDQILKCGQVFSYYEKKDGGFIIVSGDKFADVKKEKGRTIIKTSSVSYFYNYFDLGASYEDIKKKIVKCDRRFLKYITLGCNIRILRQEIYQTIISFILSSNNNIKRIRKIIENICRCFGKKLKCGKYSFPSLDELKDATKKDFENLGAGYRSEYLVKSIGMLRTSNFSEEKLKEMKTEDLKKRLISLRGVGEKVADCILFFGFHRTDVFPIDTWTRKGFKLLCSDNKTDREIEKYFIDTFHDLSGYAQQYLYNYMLNFS